MADVRAYNIDELISDAAHGGVNDPDASAYPPLDPDSTLTDALTRLREIATQGRPYVCPKCAGKGRHARSLDTGNPADTSLIRCTLGVRDGISVLCDGYGQLSVQVRAKRIAQFEEVES